MFTSRPVPGYYVGMDIQTIIKAVLLVEAVTHGIREFAILDAVRYRLTCKSVIASKILSCFECTGAWVSIAVVLYLFFIDYPVLTWLIIVHRAAVVLHILINSLDALRALISNRV